MLAHSLTVRGRKILLLPVADQGISSRSARKREGRGRWIPPDLLAPVCAHQPGHEVDSEQVRKEIMHEQFRKLLSFGKVCAATIWVLVLVVESLHGQTGSESSVGYIDSALPCNTWRIRFDAQYDDTNPSRAEFFYPKGGVPGSPGPPLPEARIDSQLYTSYLEWAVVPQFSVFVEGGLVGINPLFNADEFGVGDMNVGFKWAFVHDKDLLATFQLRTYIPTGAASRGLGTGHVSLEPALLFNSRINERLALEGELRYWTPIGGSDFSGDVIRYGIGLACPDREGFWATPVGEIVGWTVLGGKQLAVISPTDFTVESAAGTTIVNFKLGVRIGFEDYGDLYIGYGCAVTDSAWYRNIIRAEFRWFF
jgi:hypothetical protein